MSSRRNLKASLERNRESMGYGDPLMKKSMTDEDLRIAAFESRRNRGDASTADKISDDNTRNSLLRKAGFDWFDILDIKPNPKNEYTIDPESVENLAALIEHSHETQPLVLRETSDGIEIVDGERRWTAHKLLYERTGNDFWRMVPGRCHPLGSLSDEQAEFIMHSNNIGQRAMTPSERAMGFAAVADALVEWRKNDPSLKGKKTREILAERFGVSATTVDSELSIAKKLTPEGKELLDDGKLRKDQATSISRLSEDEQKAITDAIIAHNLDSKEIKAAIKSVKAGEGLPDAVAAGEAKEKKAKPQPKTTESYLKSARTALKKAVKSDQAASFALIGELKELIRELEGMQD